MGYTEKVGGFSVNGYDIIKRSKRREYEVLTRQKIKRVLMRLPYILRMMDEDITEGKFYISKKTEWIVIDEDVKAIVGIINDILKRHSGNWAMDILQGKCVGEKDIKIMRDSPTSPNGYYYIKKELIHKIYACCATKGLIPYEEIINEAIG